MVEKALNTAVAGVVGIKLIEAVGNIGSKPKRGRTVRRAKRKR